MVNLAKLKDEQERLESQGQNILNDMFVQMPEKNGVLVLRLLPDAPKALHGHEDVFFQKTRLHRINNRSLHCPKELTKVNGKWRWMGDCPVCDHYNWLWNESKKPECSADKAKKMQSEARAIKPVERSYYNVLVRKEIDAKTNEVNENVGPKVYSAGVKMQAFIMRAIFGDEELEEDPLGDISDPITGRDLKIIKTMVKGGDGEFYPNYDQSKFLDPSPLGTPEQVEEWMENLHDLQKLRSLKDYSELEKEMVKYFGGETDDEEGSYDPQKYGYNSDGPGANNDSVSVTITSEVPASTTETDASEASVESNSIEDESDDSMSVPEDDFVKGLAEA